MRFRFTIAGMLRFSVLIGLLCALGSSVYRLFEFDYVNALAASADGQVLVASKDKSGISVWDTDSGQLLQNIATASSLYIIALEVSPDGRRIALCDAVSRRCELWVRDGSQFRPKKVPTASLDGALVAISQDCRWQVTHNALKKEFGIWSLDDGTKLAKCVEQGAAAGSDSSVGLDHGTGRLVAGYDDGHVDVFDAASGQLLKTIATSHPPRAIPGEIELSPDGRWMAFALTEPTAPFYWNSIIDLDAGKEVLQVYPALRPAAFSSDSRTIAMIEGSTQSLELYDHPFGNPSREKVQCLTTVTEVVNLGPRRWALETDSRVELWKEGMLGPELVVWRGETGEELAWEFLGVIAWFVVEAVISVRRGRMVCSVCGQVRLIARRKPKPICTVCNQQSRKHGPLRAIWLMVAGLALVVLGLAGIDWLSGKPIDPAAILLAALSFAGIVAVFVLYVAWFRWRYSRLHDEARDLKHTRQIAGNLGTVDHQGPLTVWRAGQSNWLADAGEACAAAHAAVVQLSGMPIDVQRPLRVLGFERWRQFDEYLRVYGINAFSWPGVYVLAPERKIVLSAEGARAFLTEPATLVRSLSTLWYLERIPHLQKSVWLGMGLNFFVAFGGNHALLRRKLAALATQSPLGETLFDARRQRRLMRWRRWYRPDDFGSLSRCHFERASLVCFLAGDEGNEKRREQFRELVGALADGADEESAFEQHYGANLAQTVAQWRDWVAGQPLPDYPTPSSEQKQIITEELLPLIRDREALVIERLRVIRGLAYSGTVYAARDLVELLTDGDPTIRATAAWSLAMISGEYHGDDLLAWRRWCDSLQGEELLIAAD